ncbi:hypothetical protein K466DRAFT_604197 [Polyporus arcularius HHB13444]|uniref:Uncharacterized protein n=1 Tax=Polyporus arcularius HHB13444 TaxID=1314778 RepID=A0A5C3NX10_9APHY|nr:hypothetical protein K466DRAFT_604197 [Polyporus arcularius HHB13444]
MPPKRANNRASTATRVPLSQGRGGSAGTAAEDSNSTAAGRAREERARRRAELAEARTRRVTAARDGARFRPSSPHVNLQSSLDNSTRQSLSDARATGQEEDPCVEHIAPHARPNPILVPDRDPSEDAQTQASMGEPIISHPSTPSGEHRDSMGDGCSPKSKELRQGEAVRESSEPPRLCEPARPPHQFAPGEEARGAVAPPLTAWEVRHAEPSSPDHTSASRAVSPQPADRAAEPRVSMTAELYTRPDPIHRLPDLRLGEQFRAPTQNLMLAHARMIGAPGSGVRSSPPAWRSNLVVLRSPPRVPVSVASTPSVEAPPLTPLDEDLELQQVEFDEDAGVVTGIPPPAGRRRTSAPLTPNSEVVDFLESRYPRRMSIAKEMSLRSDRQTRAGYRKNIMVRLILSTFTDLSLGTGGTDVKRRDIPFDGRLISVSTADIVLAFGVRGNTFSTSRTHVELCYKVYQWMEDNRTLWDSAPESDDQRLYETLSAYCRVGVLPPSTSAAAASLTRAERNALLSGSRQLYDACNGFLASHPRAQETMQSAPVVYEPEV